MTGLAPAFFLVFSFADRTVIHGSTLINRSDYNNVAITAPAMISHLVRSADRGSGEMSHAHPVDPEVRIQEGGTGRVRYYPQNGMSSHFRRHQVFSPGKNKKS
jgi:hypothetical protein